MEVWSYHSTFAGPTLVEGAGKNQILPICAHRSGVPLPPRYSTHIYCRFPMTDIQYWRISSFPIYWCYGLTSFCHSPYDSCRSFLFCYLRYSLEHSTSYIILHHDPLHVFHRRLKIELFHQSYPAWILLSYNCFVKCPSYSTATKQQYNLGIWLWLITNL